MNTGFNWQGLPPSNYYTLIFCHRWYQCYGPDIQAPSYHIWLPRSREMQALMDDELRRNLGKSWQERQNGRAMGGLPLHVDIPSVPISSANTQSPSSSRSPKSSRKFSCELCKDVLGTKQSLEAHIRAKHEGWRVCCPGCGSSFSFLQALQRHLREDRCPSPKF